MVDTKFLELVNATLGLSILLIAFVLIRDFRKQLQNKENKLKIPLILMGVGIMVFSIREFLKYGLTEGEDTVLDELLETVYLLLTLGAFFSLLMIKELPSWKVKH
jgi:hypothetical protein